MSDFLLHLELSQERSYQQQIREKLIGLIQHDQFGQQPLPSSRKMAQLLGVSRNTVVLVYEGLVDDGYLVSRERSGFFVNDALRGEQRLTKVQSLPLRRGDEPNWCKRFQQLPSQMPALDKDRNWMSYPYPFIYGQVDPEQFPLNAWRDCTRQAQSRSMVREWVEDLVDADDPMLVEQIRHQLLSKRGICAGPDEILLTLGSQNALYMLATLLAGDETLLGSEEPGYADVRNIFTQAGAKLRPLQLDDEGVRTGAQLSGCDYLYVTPSHQYPTTVTMSLERRKALLQQAYDDDFILIEDDYESEVNFLAAPQPALKSLDQHGRVIYMSSLSKCLSPGLRLGYMVADKALITQLRALRRLIYRHPPLNNQRTTALFIAQGHYDCHIRSMRQLYQHKWKLMAEGLEAHLPQCHIKATPGSFCFWIRLPEPLCAVELSWQASELGILIEPGDPLFQVQPAPAGYFRLGFAAIPIESILPGLKHLGALIDRCYKAQTNQCRLAS